MKKTMKERFYEKVGIDMKWTGAKTPFGYGKLYVNGKLEYAHRISYKIYNGEIPEGMLVLHSCDDGSCVNPDHLHLGTDADNMREMQERGRKKPGISKGEKNGRAKLTEKEVIEIRKNYKNGIKPRYLSKKYNIGVGSIFKIVSRKQWTHI